MIACDVWWLTIRFAIVGQGDAYIFFVFSDLAGLMFVVLLPVAN